MYFSQIQTAISQCFWQINFQDFNFQPNAPYIPNIVCDYAWHPPPEGWVKLNVDGSCLSNPGDASAGCLLRDASSNWLLGFSFNIGETSVLAAELIGISFGLQLAWLNGFRRVIVESDCLKAVKLINNEKDIFFHPLAALIQDCRRLMKMNWHCCLSHVYREQNFCADSLARQSHGLQIQEMVKLNVDGSCLGNPGDASAGGLLRDASSNWLLGFGFNIGETSILAAELIGISFGLQLAWLNGFRRVIVESDV
ncbi:hypothetical protein GH714_037023 [Hevea brasiliensis]|uniref:RNase H type-1 domain-containing protein n=1 Tax=Hevea brasiliensis TaxID=3981 RepID=A0A6A6KKU1_HEVBR|nr:hypothetical protein GH714_037023 [Hevea brasiliensis]